MEGMKGGGRVCVGEDEMSDGMQCIDHPHRNNTSGICAFCLQDKLGKLVSSSFPSSSSSPSFRSHTAYSITTAASAPPPATSSSSSSSSSSYSSLSLSVPPTSAKKNGAGDHEYYMRSLLPFLIAKKNKKNKPSTNTSSSSSDVIFKRSKSSATPRRDQFVDDEDFSPRKRNGFWSFLYLSSKPSASSSSSTCSKKFEANSFRDINGSTRISTGKQRDKCLKSDMVVEEDASSLERKVSRSRSVGCGSRSFSGDFFERISTGLGDCTLRRVESQREGNKPKVAVAAGTAVNRGGDHHHRHHCMKERVKCGGIFGGFMMMTSSSSLSCSTYWVSSSADDSMNGESVGVGLSNGRPKSWGWVFASPMRAFSSKTSSKENKRDGIRDASDNNATPNLSAIPSLLTVTG